MNDIKEGIGEMRYNNGDKYIKNINLYMNIK